MGEPTFFGEGANNGCHLHFGEGAINGCHFQFLFLPKISLALILEPRP